MRYKRMKYLKRERGIYYYRRGKFRLRLDADNLLSSWKKADDDFNRSSISPANTFIIPGSFRELVTEYKASADYIKLKPGPRRQYRRYADIAMSYFADYPANDIKMHHIVEVRDQLSEMPAKANDFVKIMRVIYGWGLPRNKVDHNPADFRHTSIKMLPTGSYQPWPEPLIERALNEMRPEIAWVLAMCLYTGQRIGDVLKMSWADKSLGGIDVTQEKTQKRLKIPLHPELEKLLNVIPKRSVRILTSYTGRVWSMSRWQEAVAAERKRLGISDYVTHGLRKNAVIRLLYASCTTEQVGSITGHSPKMVDYYAKDIEQEKLAVIAMGKYAQWSENKRNAK